MKKKLLLGGALLLLAGLSFISYRSLSSKSQPKILSEKDTKQTADQPSKVLSEPSDASADESSTDQSDAELDNLYKDLNGSCEAGQWVNLETLSGEKKSFTGKFSIEVPFEEDGEVSESETSQDQYFLNGNTQVISQKDDILGFFEGREVEISGIQEQGKIKPEKIRCTGKETDKNLLNFRQDVMNYVNKNLSSLVPQKGDWEVYDIAWPADDYIYVDYAAVEPDNEDSADENVYALLLQVSKENDQIKTSQVGYLKMSDSDEEDWDVISGTDKFKGIEDMDFYEYDDELNKWVK